MNILIFFLVSGWIEGWCRVSGNYLDLHPESSWFASNIYMVTQSLKIAGRYNISNLKETLKFCRVLHASVSVLLTNVYTSSWYETCSQNHSVRAAVTVH